MAAFEEVFGGKRFKIVMTPKVIKAWNDFETRPRARLEALMKRYVDDGPEHFTDTQLVVEDRYPIGPPAKAGTTVLVCAFKAHQHRVYGALLPGTNLFVCSETDIKKQDKADADTLARTAKNLADFLPSDKISPKKR